MKNRTILNAAALFLAAAASVQASVVIGNLPLANELNTSDSLSSSSWYTVGVNIPSGSSWDLTNIKLDMTSTATPVLEILGPSTSPGGAVFSSFNAPSQSGNVWTFTPSASFSFGASSTYWIVVGESGAATGTWLRSSGSDTPYTPGVGTYAATYSSANGGSSWSFPFPSGGNPGLEINAVPEPQEYAMIAGLGLLAFAVWRRTTAAKAA